MRKLTPAETTLRGAYPYATADLGATVDALQDGPQAFVDLDQGKSASAKIVLRP
jgi:hypothetical protein